MSTADFEFSKIPGQPKGPNIMRKRSSSGTTAAASTLKDRAIGLTPEILSAHLEHYPTMPASLIDHLVRLR